MARPLFFITCGAPSLLGELRDVPGSEGSTAAWGEETSASMWICSYSYTPVFRIEMKYLSAEQLEKIEQRWADPCRGDAALIIQVESFPTGIVFSSRANACSSYSRAIPLALFPD